MADLQAPIVSLQIKAGKNKAGFTPHKALIIAQGSGTNKEKTLAKKVQRKEAEQILGAGSMALMAFNRFRKYNPITNIDFITLKEPLGAKKAEGQIKIVGTAKENSTLNLSIGDDAFDLKVTILKGFNSISVARAIEDAINKKTSHPFTATISSTDKTVILVKFKIGGTSANGLIIRLKNRILGCQVSSVKFSGGVGVYDVDNILKIATDRYQTVMFDSSMKFDDVEAWLEARVNMTNTVKGGSGFTMINDDLASLQSFAEKRNSKTMTIFGNPDEMKFNAIPLLAVAEFGAKRALRLTPKAVLGNLVVESQEAFGGVSKSSLPYHNTPLSYEEPDTQIDIHQVKALNKSGVSLFVPATIGTALGSVTTLYKIDNTGSEDKTYKFLNAFDTSLAIQEYFFNNCKKEFGQTRSTDGELVAGIAMTNNLSVKAYIMGLYSDLVTDGLAQGGVDAQKSFKTYLKVDLDVTEGSYSVFAPVPIVSQFRALDGIIEISYNFK